MYKVRRLIATNLILMSSLILATLCCATPVTAEVRRSNGRIVMEEADYRFFITRIKALEAENAALTKAIAEERSSFDVYVSNVQEERKLHAEQTALYERRVDELSEDVRRLKRQKALLSGSYENNKAAE